jgi:hypothetical protein
MAERVRDVSDHDLALYRAIVGGHPVPPAVSAHSPGWRRRLAALNSPGAPLDVMLRLARRRLGEGLKRIGLANRLQD